MKSRNNHHLVSIITPTYNSEKFIEYTIKSVRDQKYGFYEHIIIDDCSQDDTVGLVCRECVGDPKIILIRLEFNSGAGVARNEGIKRAKGRYLAFLDADDFWHPKKLQSQITVMQEKSLPVVYTQYYIVKGQNNVPDYTVNSPKRTSYRKMLRNDYIGFLTLIYDTHVLGKQFMPEIRRRQDWAYKLQLLKNIDYAYGIQQPLAYYRVGNSSLSSNKFKLLKYNYIVFNRVLGFSKFKSVFSLINFLAHYFYYKGTSRKKVKRVGQ